MRLCVDANMRKCVVLDYLMFIPHSRFIDFYYSLHLTVSYI